jgi:hypothetical protein
MAGVNDFPEGFDRFELIHNHDFLTTRRSFNWHFSVARISRRETSRGGVKHVLSPARAALSSRGLRIY